jgi:hypothetical protein
MVVRRSRSRQLARIRIAYLAYAICAVIVTLFQLVLCVEEAEVAGFLAYLIMPLITIAGAIAFALSVAVRSDTGLSVLGGATLALAGLQLLTVAGVIGTWMNAIARAYVLLVFCVIFYCRRSWLREEEPGG